MLSSCGIYTKYERPDVAIDSTYRDLQSTDTTSLAQLSWRELFTDKKLQNLIELGLSQNTDFQVALLQIEASQASLRSAKLAYLPSLDFVAEGGISRYNGTTKKTHSLGLEASWEIDVFGKMTNAKRSAKAVLEASEAYAQAVKTQIVATIAESYYTLLMLDEQLRISEATLTNWDSTIAALEVLARAGQSNDVAVHQAKANRIALEASILTIKSSITTTENSLSALLKESPHIIDRGILKNQAFTDSLLVGIPIQLLSNRPDVRQAEFNLAEAFYATNSARSAFYPTLSLSGTLGWTNSGGSTIINPGKWLTSAAAQLTAPIFNRGTNRANLQIAKATQQQALLLFEQAIIDAGTEVNDALTQCQCSRERIELDKAQIEQLQAAVDKTNLLMRYSSTNYLEVLTAQQSLLSAQLTLAEDQTEFFQNVINLYHSLGGGSK